MNNKFSEVQDRCLDQAKAILESNAALSEEAARAAKTFVEIAGAIETLNLQWAVKIQSGAALRAGRPWGERREGSSAATSAE